MSSPQAPEPTDHVAAKHAATSSATATEATKPTAICIRCRSLNSWYGDLASLELDTPLVEGSDYKRVAGTALQSEMDDEDMSELAFKCYPLNFLRLK